MYVCVCVCVCVLSSTDKLFSCITALKSMIEKCGKLDKSNTQNRFRGAIF